MDAIGAKLLDHIYDAALDPQLWPRFLRALAAGYPGGQGVMYTVAPGTAQVVLANWDPAWTQAYNTHFDRVNPWLPRMSARPAGMVDTAEQMMPRPEFHRTEYFNDFLKPQGLETGVGATIQRIGQRVVGTSVLFKAEAAGPDHLHRLVSLVPHLRRAVEVNAALAGATFRAQAAEAVLHRMDQPAAVVDADSRVLLCNRAAEALLTREVLRGPGAAGLRRLVRATVLGTGAEGAGPHGAGGWSRLPRPAGSPRDGTEVRVLAMPLRGTAQLLASLFPDIGHAALLLISDGSDPGAPDAEGLCRRHGLTPSEARVAILLMGGKPPVAIAAALGLRVSTVRQYLKAVYGKTDTHGQAELLSLLRTR